MSSVNYANAYDYQREKDLIRVSVNIIDETSRPIPYVTVWGSSLPQPSTDLALTPDGLWRITQRYQSSFEFATPYNRIVHAYHVRIMGNKEGLFKEDFDFQGENGYKNKRPEKLELTYTFMKRGYLPALITIPVGRESSVTAKVTLKRDPNSALEQSDYLQRFDAIRYEFSDTSKDEIISMETHNRNELLRQELEGLAKKATEAHDNKIAARIYMRMTYLPKILFDDSRPSGWVHQTAGSLEAIQCLREAYKLDPNNSYISLTYLAFNNPLTRYEDETGLTKYNPFKATKDVRLEVDTFLKDNKSILDNFGEEVWPKFYMGYIGRMRFHSDIQVQNKTSQLLDELYKFEPNYESLKSIQESKEINKRKQKYMQNPDCLLNKNCSAK